MTDENMTKGERTRSGIIQTAHQLFIEQGYHGTSMRQVAADAGISLGGIYNHFVSKEEIFMAVLEAYHPYHEMLPIIKNAQGESIEAFVHNAASGMIAALDKRPDFLNLMFIEIVEFGSRHIPQIFTKYFPLVMGIVQRFAEKQGNLRPIPLPIIIRIFIGLFLSYYMTEYILGEQLPANLQQGALQYSVDIFLHGVVSGE